MEGLSFKEVALSLFEQHGKRWPGGKLDELAEKFGRSKKSLSSQKSQLWRDFKPRPAGGHHFQESLPVEPEPVAAAPADDDWESNISAQHWKTLEKAAISADRIAKVRTLTDLDQMSEGLQRWGQKVMPVMEFTWTTVSGKSVKQVRLKDPVVTKGGHEVRYLFEDGASGLVGIDPAFKDHLQDPRIPALIVEGTKQFLSAASALEDDHPAAVPFGIPGCWGWSSEQEPCQDLRAMALANRDVLVGFDADLLTNPQVYLAARRLKEYLEGEFLARSVRFLVIPGGAKDGLDDLLGRQDSRERRVEVLRNLIQKAIELPAKGPRMPSKNSGFFDSYGNFKPNTCWEFLVEEYDLAMAGDKSIAVYSDGVYWNGDSLKFRKLLSDTLANHYKPEFENTLIKLGLAHLKVSGIEVPFRQPRLIINFTNGLLDLETMKLRAHTPEHRTLIQLPVAWDPEAKSPVFDQWLDTQLPGQGDVLIDVSSQMLDQTRQPTQMVFLYGPSRSGKSTFLRILRWIAGERLSSAVSMHQLATNRFAPARLFGRILNTFADLSADDLRDLSVLKALTGEDALAAENKNAAFFDLENMAMLAFSANSIPAVSETSLAYFARVSAFHFERSFLGAEDPTLEPRMREELPGIVKRLVLALKARHERGRFLQADQKVQEEFARQSDRVRMFLSECTRPGDRSKRCIKRADLYPLFCDWLREETDGRGKAMGKQKFNAKVRAAGVEEFKPKDCPFLWDLLRIDPETVEAELFKTVDPVNGANELTEVGIDEAGFDSSDPKVSTESVNAEITSEQSVLPLSVDGSKTLSTVSPYPTPYRKEDQKFPQTPRWVESVETVDLEPYRGLTPTGIVYISREEDLPDLVLLPKSVGFDLETYNRRTDLWRHKASLSPSLGGEIRLAQISDGTTTWIIDVAVLGQPAIEWLRSLTRDPERMLVGHNLLFEATFLLAAGIRPLCRWWDTMLACQIIGDLPSNSLASASAHYLKRLLDKAEQTSDWGGPLTASQLRYAALDAVVVLELGRVLHTELHNTGQVEAHRLDCQMICPCADGQVRGLAVDLDAAKQAQEQATIDRELMAEQLHSQLGIDNYRNPLKLKEALAEHLGEELPNTKDKTLKRFDSYPVVALLRKLKNLDNELKEVKWLMNEAQLTDGRVRPCYRIIGASTGRTSTSALIRDSSSHVPSDTETFKTGKRKGEPKPVKLGQCGFNFQGITGDRKRALGTGNPDTVLLDLDWSSIEVRLQASPRLYDDAGQRQILLDGIDPHAYIASQACGREITKADPERSSIGKPANFSLAYGCGVAGLRKLLANARGGPVSQVEAQKVYDAWHRFHPQISCQMRKFDGGSATEVRSLSGRRMTYRGNNPGPDGVLPKFPLGRTNGINFPIQGSGRDLLADALADLWPALDAFPGAHIVGLIHDEILIEVPKNQVEEIKAVALEAMTSERLREKYMGDIPLEADASVAENWGDAH